MEQDARRLIVRLAVAVMTADGRITASEEAAIMRFDRLGLGPLSTIAKEEIRQASQVPADIAATCEELTGMSPEAAAVLVTLLSEIAVSDGTLSDSERNLLCAIATLMGLEASQTTHIIESVAGAYAADAAPASGAPHFGVASEGRFAGGPAPAELDLARAYRILGLEPGASRPSIDSAFLRLVDRYNPAKASDLGPDFAVLAVRKLAEVTSAFEAVRVSVRPPPD